MQRDAPVICSYVSACPQADLASIDDVIGQHHIVQEIRRRVRHEDHARPLLLSGPPGSGKRSLARLYAKRLLCEGEGEVDGSPDTCGKCAVCEAFASGSLWGYLEFDMTHVDIVQSTRCHIEQLRYEPVSDRRVVVLRDPDYSDEATDAFLRTLERGAKATTFIILTGQAEKVRPAARSRSDSFVLKAVTGLDAQKLVRKWLPTGRTDESLISLIALHGSGRPGTMYHLAKMIVEHAAWTVQAAKSVFELNWGEDALRYLCALLNGEDCEWARANIDPSRVVVGIRSALYEVSVGREISEAALVGFDRELRSIDEAIDQCAARLRISSGELWDRLATHWSCDGVVDAESFMQASQEAQLIVRGRA